MGSVSGLSLSLCGIKLLESNLTSEAMFSLPDSPTYLFV